MINHVRTLLLNLRRLDGGPGEEYVPADYQPVTLPDRLLAARTALLGAGADRYGANATLARVMAAVDAHPTTRVAAREDDGRVTYGAPWPAVPANSVAGPAGAYLLGSPVAFASSDGRGASTWVVVTSGGATTATIQTATTTYVVSPLATGPGGPTAGRVADVSVADPWVYGYDEAEFYTAGSAWWEPPPGPQVPSRLIPLPDSAAYLVIPVQDGTWVVQAYAAPGYNWVTGVTAYGDWGAVLTGGTETDEALLAVWEAGPAGYDRAAAFAVALARRINELRS